MVRRFIFVLLFLAFIPLHAAQAKVSPSINQGIYVTTEDIILDIIFPKVDKSVQKEYQNKNINWQWTRITDITYINNHSYEMNVKITVDGRDWKAEDLVKVKILLPCDSNKLNCKGKFKVAIINYHHLSKK
nr:DUF3888 domain-containing protein [Neobacillus sp. Marseille-Q6967]